MEHIDCIVAGAGVIGLAVARALSLAGREVLVVEAESAIGTQTSSRNSEVVHAGLYYPVGSAKARLCIQGRERLYRYAEDRGIPHRRCGKLIVAGDAAQAEKLQSIEAAARACGVEDLVLLDGATARAFEPALKATAALHSPSTGIIDSHAYMLALQGDADNAGAGTVFETEIAGGRIEGERIVLFTRHRPSGEMFDLSASLLVNAAGLSAPRLAASIEDFPKAHVPKLTLAKGNYFSAAGRSPFSRLIYPVPVDGGLGVHLTFDLGGQMRFGPDVEWVDDIDYEVDPARGDAFYEAIRRYWPSLPDGGLTAAYSGIRPKLSGQGEAAADFAIEGPETHGVAGIVNLFGIESPGLTASLAIADHVRAITEMR